MSQNYINLLINDLERRWNEITILLASAEDHIETDIDLHDAICRSVTVLMVANLEGFYKELIKSIINDINDYYDFVDLPDAIKRGFCSNFLDQKSGPNIQNEITNKLIKNFDVLNADLNHEPFLFDRNNNPKPDVIKKLFKGLGVRKVFKRLQSSRYEQVFREENSYLERKIPEYITEISNLSKTFPYQSHNPCFSEQTSSAGNNRTFWEEFLDDLNRSRHAIAHGNEYSNVESVRGLLLIKNKIIFLQIAFIHILVEEFGMN